MASLVLSGDTSGTVTLAAPAVAGTQSYTLPTAVPAASGYALTSTTGGTMSWASTATSPAGSNTQIQYNNSGAFGASAGLTFDGTSVGVGLSPNTFSTVKAVQIGSTGAPYLALAQSLTGNADGYMLWGAYVTGNRTYAYMTTGDAVCQYRQVAGTHNWYSAPSGTTGNAVTFTQVLGVNRDQSLALQGATSQSGTGVSFPATQSASTDANTLDDYEEGTWSPVISDGTNNATMTTTSGNYVKVGTLVYITCNAYIAAIGSLSGNLRITGLPFAISGDGVGVACGYGQQLSITAGNAVSLYGGNGTSYLQLRIWNATTGTGQLSSSNLIGANSGVGFSLSYKTT
jgi:hypothetical protein